MFRRPGIERSAFLFYFAKISFNGSPACLFWGYFNRSNLFKSSTYIDALRSTSNLVRDGQALRYANFIKVYLPLPPVEEQDAIAAYLDQSIVAIDEAISRQKQLIERLGEYRKSLILHAVTGQIDCSEE